MVKYKKAAINKRLEKPANLLNVTLIALATMLINPLSPHAQGTRSFL